MMSPAAAMEAQHVSVCLRPPEARVPVLLAGLLYILTRILLLFLSHYSSVISTQETGLQGENCHNLGHAVDRFVRG